MDKMQERDLKEAADENVAFIKCSSHRSRNKVTQLVGRQLRYWWSMHHHYHVHEVPAGLLDEVLKIKGVTRSKPTKNHHRAAIGGTFLCRALF